MALADLTELNTVRDNWTENLNNHRAALLGCQADLQKAAEQKLHYKDMPEVDHFYNQFDIQLNNISHFKHEIKELEKMADWDTKENNGKISSLLTEQYETIADRYRTLVHTIEDLESDFEKFLTNHLN